MSGFREVFIGSEQDCGEYARNTVTTSKYTAVNFVPKNLWEQLHKFGNVYFLIISVLMYIGEKTPLFVGSIKAFSTLGTLLMMMMVTAFMAFVDDHRRKKADRLMNNRKAHRIEGRVASTSTWGDLKVGDVIRVEKDEELPADIVPLWSSGDRGTCFVSTANLDGETNLKLKAAPGSSQHALGDDSARVLEKLQSTSGSVLAESPTPSIHEFSGILRLKTSNNESPLNVQELLLRGSVLRNTDSVLGVVVYTGRDTRMVMNSQPVPMKISNIERITNLAMVLILATQGCLAFGTMVVFILSKSQYENLWYLLPPQIWLPDVVGYWLTFFVLFSNLMPISLYPTMEVCNAVQSHAMKTDPDMRHRGRILEEDVDFPAGVRSSNLCQELGQVSYLFSDKTGTLTQNVMELKKISVDGEIYGVLDHEVEESGQSPSRGFQPGALHRDWKGSRGDCIDSFFEVMTLAHSVLVSKSKHGSKKFESSSPDEVALLDAADSVGWGLERVSEGTITVRVRKEERLYNILATNVFDSNRKRMSVIVERDGVYSLMAKGADNVMMERCTKSKPFFNDHVTKFANEGLRTLLLARRTLTREEVDAWMMKFREAEKALQNRDGALADVAEEIEQNMEIVGVTAVEDKLQLEVPDTIVKIRAAGIKLWVLTGDRLETARDIGITSKVLDDDMEIFIIDRDVNGEVDLGARGTSHSWRKQGMLVTGAALGSIMADTAKKHEFLHLAAQCDVVIACRVSPLQKAEMVRLVREGIKPTPVTMSIGDGANDVPMIQEAQVGVGIAGREGLQAVNNSDFALGQFRFLTRLLLVHGRWNYLRACKFTLYTFWRNAVQVMLIFMYTGMSGFSGTSLFEDWLRLSFNFLCSLPIIATGCFDQDVTERFVLKNPAMYGIGQRGEALNGRKTALYLVIAGVHSSIIFALTFAAFPGMDMWSAGDYYTFGTAVYTCLLIDMNYRVLFVTVSWNAYVLGFVLLSFVLYAVYLMLYPGVKVLCDILAPNMYQVPLHMTSNWTFWLCVVSVPCTVLFFDVLLSYLISNEGRLLPREQDSLHDISCDHSSTEETEPVLWVGRDGTSTFDGSLRRTVFRLKRDAKWVVVVSLSCGMTLLFLSMWAFTSSASAAQVRVLYDGKLAVPSMLAIFGGSSWYPLGTHSSEVFDGGSCTLEQEPLGSSRVCKFQVALPRDMRAPVMVQYTLGPYFQNHDAYLKSEVPAELEGESASEGTRFSKCEATTRSWNGKEWVPCGMKSVSLFNDSFSIAGKSIDETSIAWDSDIERYNNPLDYGQSGKSWLYERFPSVVRESEGVKNEHFVAWMRPSAFPRVWNSYGWLREDLHAGETLKITIHNRYPVEWPNGYKELVLTERNALGGRHHGLSLVFFILALIMLITGAVFKVFVATERGSQS